MPRIQVCLLGPQRLQPTVDKAVAALGVRGPVAAVTAGWEEREEEDGELRDHLDRDVVNLEVYRRGEDVFAEDPRVLSVMRERHDTLREVQELYRLRLAGLLEAARTLLEREGDGPHLEAAREGAILAARRLDQEHLDEVTRIHADFDGRWNLLERPAVQRHRKELKQLLAKTEALCVAGGHVAILLNRMRMFGLLELVGKRPIIAWSAGAMAVAERIVLFHDNPPQGPGDAEVLEVGLGACRGIVPLPHARKRLRLDDPARVSLFARRFGPALCIALEPGARLDWDGKGWTAPSAADRLAPSGEVLGVGAS